MEVFLENFTVPDYLKTGERANITVRIVNRGPGEKNLRLTLTADGEEHISNIAVQDAYPISLPVSFTLPGIKEIRIDLKDTDVNLSSARTIEVYEEPVVYYYTEMSEGKAILKVDVKKSKIKDVKISVGSGEMLADEILGEKDFEFSLAPGEYLMKIECSDIAGNPREISETIEFREKNILEIIMDALNGFIQQIMSIFRVSG
jgi:hypothetical protein